jgi:hypothetical protein
MSEKAWRALLADPTVMAGSLVRNAVNYFVDLPTLLFRQYTRVASIPSEWIALGVAGPILVVAARIRSPFYARALGLFALVFLTTVASAAMIYAANGERTLIVTNLLLSLGLALGFALPEAPRPSAPVSPGRRGLYVIPIVVVLMFGLPALVKAKALYKVASPDFFADTMRIGPGTPAILVLNESFPDRRQMIVRSELLRQIGHSVSFDPEFTQALDYSATAAPGTLLAIVWSQFLLGGPDLLKHRGLDLRVQFARENPILSRIERWWPDPANGSPP